MQVRRTLAFLLVLTMLLALLPASVIAVEAEQETNAETTCTEQTEETQERLHPMLDGQTARERGHKERLRDEEGNHLNKLVYRNRDGSKTMYLFQHPVKYRDEHGQTHDISLEIDDTGDAAYPFRTRANSAVTQFPASLPDGITLQGNGVELRLSGRGHNGRLVDENTVSYTYDAKTTIEYALTYTGFKEDIVVSEYTGQTEYPFTLYTNGLYVTQLDGGYYLTDDAGTIQAVIGEIIVFTADERNNTFGSLRVATVEPGQQYELTIVLDAQYLADPNTVYPIRIDPTVELVYTDEAPNAIEEKTIQSNGTTNGSNSTTAIGFSTYGINRSIMKFPGLDFEALEGVTVTSAVVSIRDLMCETEALTVTCYPFTGSVWTESTAQWSNLAQSWGAALDSKVVSYYSGLEQESAHRYCFDITSLAQKWVDGLADPAKGIIFRADSTVENGSTIIYKTFATSERSGYRPKFVITYQDAVAIVPDEADIDEGSSTTLTVHSLLGISGGVAWESSDEEIAKVDSNGVVTGVKAGTATITATVTDIDGVEHKPTCTVYITVADGVYYIKNVSYAKCLANDDATVDSVSTHIEKENTSSVTDPTQFWQITYLGDGWYSIRPVDRILAVLTADNSGNVVVQDLAENATLPAIYKWKIIQDSSGYVFLHKGLPSSAMTAEAVTEGSNVSLSDKSANPNCHWKLDAAIGLVLRDTATQRAITTSPTKTIELGRTYTLADLDLSYKFYGNRTRVTWRSDSTGDYDIVSVDTYGTVTPNYGGESTITLTVSTVDTDYSISFTLISILPLSGDELDYEPYLWNNNADIKDGTRCYSYALNVQVHPENNTPWNIIVGWHSGHAYDFVGGPINMTIVESYANDDARELGFTFAPIDKDAVCDPGCYKVALVIDTNADYHWYRQNPDGTWSHKLAQGDVTNLDADNNFIYDPCIANKDYTDVNGKNYEDGTRYYQISPLNYLYNENYTSSATLTEQISTPVEKRLSDVNAKICFDLLSAEVALLFTEQDSEDFV